MPGQELAVTAKKEKEVVVFIDGLFGGGVAGSARKALSARFPSARFVTLHCGAVSSVRDRAVECFYQLKGGQTDYCVANPNLEKGHGRYGLKYPGLHPEWDETQPIHIIAYSLGAPTARFLQHLLIRQAFTNKNGDPMRSSGGWVASITTLNGVNNGTMAVYAVGLSPFSKQPLPFSILWWIFSLIYVAVWCEWERAEKSWKLQLGHWEVRKEHGVSLPKLMLWRPGGADNGGRDLCPASIAQINAEIESTLPHPTTRYLACCASCTTPLPLSGVEVPTVGFLLQWQAVFLVPLSLVVSVTAYLQALLRFCLAPVLFLLSLLPLPRRAAVTGKDARDHGQGSAVVASKGCQVQKKKSWGLFGSDMRCAHVGGGVKCDGAWPEGLRREQANDGVCSIHCQSAPASDARRALGARHCCLNALVQEGVASGKWTEVQMPSGFSHVELCQGTARAEDFLSGLCTLVLQKKVFLGAGPEEVEDVGGSEKMETIRKKLDRHEKWVGKVLDKSKSPVKRSPSKTASSPN